MIALVDYGIGNLRSVYKALVWVGAKVSLTCEPERVLRAEKVILPGVGAFGDGIEGLKSRGLVDAVRESVILGKPILGICLGMQLLFEASDENGKHQGFGLLPGNVTRFAGDDIKVPHTGWNQVYLERETPLLSGIPSGSYAYFNHSHYCHPSRHEDVLASTDYGLVYASVVGNGQLYGMQFHPEKSQTMGLMILRNFAEKC
jgi:imidazole glycerol-phosphate synthase subunit HisH